MKEVSQQTIDQFRVLIEEGLQGVIDLVGADSPPSALQDACRYVLGSGGKRLRGLLTCSVWRDLVGATPVVGNKAASSAIAIEILHAASLVHDDLPALDNDDLRRGKASCHRAYPEATAILTGDALFAAAISVVCFDRSLSSDLHGRISAVLSRAWWDLCIGQQMDISQKEFLQSSKEQNLQEKKQGEKQQMIRLKTGALFGAAVESAALCAGINQAALSSYTEWGVKVGECFQALDDIDDGDRPIDDLPEVLAQCGALREAAERLNPKLIGGATSGVLNLIVTPPSFTQTALHDTPSR